MTKATSARTPGRIGSLGRDHGGTLRARLLALAETAGSAAVRALARASRPRPRTLRVEGLARETVVRFDDFGVPHIRAASEADAFRALGACHGLDRFFAMDMMRHVLAGRLCEVTGERPIGAGVIPPISKGTTLDADKLMRVLDLVPAARRALSAATTDERALLDAYVEGVNSVVMKLGPRTSLEHRLVGLSIEPWTALDAVIVGKGMALGLSFKWRSTPVFAAIAEVLADRPAHLAAILPRVPGDGQPVIARLSAASRGLAAALETLGWETPLAGSNSFVVGSARSASGFPILANDPHLMLSLPSVWYLASVTGGAYAAVGATLPGLPGVVIGRTPSAAWSFTNVQLDDADVCFEELDGTGTRYRLDGQWRDLDVETQEIRRKGKGPVIFRVRRTHRGPLLTDALPGAAGRALSVRLLLHETTRDLQAFLSLGKAREAADFERAAAGYGSPAQNLVYATAAKEAGYVFFGRVPRRDPGPTPSLPRDGTKSAGDWDGLLPEGALPRFRLKEDGFLVTANQPTVGPEFPHYLSHLYEPGYRAARITQLLAGRRDLRPDDLAAIQLDARSLGADAFRRDVILPSADAIRRTRPPAVPMLDRLLASSGDEGVDAVGPALLHLVYFHLARRVFGLHLGDDLALRWMGAMNLMDEPLLRAFRDPDSPWVKPAVRATFLGEALEEAARDLAASGHSIDVPWGRVHTLTLNHPLSAVPLIGRAFTLGPYPASGGPYTPSAGQYLHDRPLDMRVGASYRHVIDFADPERSSRMITYGGQSGSVGSRHYADQMPLWLAGKSLPMRLSDWPETGRDLRLVRA